ncbi:hypothetical protein UMNF18_981 [Escherichia coli UMNF18]|nr:hypothetical protein UMNF18_981 [Escherichia coli UMNF18]EII47366.1 hypothetical protein EC23916_2857 [Escherichia coli 2.3916]
MQSTLALLLHIISLAEALHKKRESISQKARKKRTKTTE